MVSHYDCAKQHILRQFNLLNVKQCTEAPSDIKHASVKTRVYVRAKAKRIKAFKCVAYAKNERKLCFQGSVKYHYSGVTGKAFQNSENVGQKLGNAWASFVVHN